MVSSNTDYYVPSESDYEKWIIVDVLIYDKIVGSDRIYFSKLPVVYINTVDGEGITSKEEYKEAKMVLQGNSKFNDSKYLYDGNIDIKGRGNSTWNAPKKPYRIKLDSKTDLLKLGKNKNWVLLANYFDSSLIKNKISYDYSGKLGMEYMSSEIVDLVFNGEYVGNYQLCEQIRIDSNRVDIFNWEDFADEIADSVADSCGFSKTAKKELEKLMEEDLSWIDTGKFSYKDNEYNLKDYYFSEIPDATGGYLIEFDGWWYDEVSKFMANGAVPTMLKSPEFLYTSESSMNYLKEYIEAFDDALFSDTFYTEYDGRKMRYNDLVDFDSLINYWIVSELFFNLEKGFRSEYAYKDVDEIMYKGPVWDMDTSIGFRQTSTNYSNYQKWRTNFNDVRWDKQLTSDPYFLIKAQEKYWDIRYGITEDLIKQDGVIDALAAYIYESGCVNWDKWGQNNNYYYDLTNYDEAVNGVKNWLINRIFWLDTQLMSQDRFVESINNYKRKNLINLSIIDARKDMVSGVAAADAMLMNGEALKVGISNRDDKIKKYCVYINGKDYIELDSTDKELDIPSDKFDSELDKKNVIVVYGVDDSGEVVDSTYCTVVKTNTISEDETYKIVAIAGINGDISNKGIKQVKKGDSLEYNIEPDGGYTIEKIIVDGVEVENSLSYEFTDINENHSIAVYFCRIVPVTKIKINNKCDTIAMDSEYQVELDIEPENTTEKSFVWEVADTEIATISDGLIHPLKVGKTTVKVSSKNDINIFDEFEVTVIDDFNIEFNANGGNVEPKNKVVTYNSAYGGLPLPQKKGYEFEGWYTSLTDGEKICAEDIVAIEEDTVLYAHWIPKHYEVTFNANNGNVSVNEINVTYGLEYGELPQPEREGYAFIGWYTELDGGNEITVNTIVDIEVDCTLYAHWSINSYEVKFDANGGKVYVEQKNVEYGNIYGELPIPEWDKHVFLGWYTEIEGGNEVTSDTQQINTCNQTLYAHWKRIFTVKFISDDDEYCTLTVDENCKVIKPDNPAKTGFIFLGWLYQEKYFDFETTINDDIVLIADWIDERAYDWGDVKPEDIKEFSTAFDIPDSIWIAGINDKSVYNGEKIVFDIRVYDNKTLLKDKIDYSVKYKNNVSACENISEKNAPCIVIEGKGNYSGSYTKKFVINRLDLSDEIILTEDLQVNSDGKVHKVIPTVYRDTVKLKNKKDYDISYEDKDYKTTGDYEITLNGKGNYKGSRIINLSITDKKLLNKASVSKVFNKAYQDGNEICPDDCELSYKGQKLIVNKDYKVDYVNNCKIGTATIIFTGIGDYAGQKKVNFKIVGIDIKKALCIYEKEFLYTGDEIKPDVALKYADKQLVKDYDYLVTYSNNISAGTGYVEIKGINGYTGKVKKKFNILKNNLLNNDDISVKIEKTVPYMKGGSKPKTSVMFKGDILVEGKDYTLNYYNNKNITDGNNSGKLPYVKIKGKGNFTGVFTTEKFVILRQDISLMKAVCNDKVYKNKSNIFKSNIVITDLNGKKLISGKDYDKTTIKYTYSSNALIIRESVETLVNKGDEVDSRDIIPIGTSINVSVKGMNAYEGEISTDYRFVRADISKATVTIPKQEYTGNPIVLDKHDIIVKLNGVALGESDFVIIEYNNNIRKGTGTVTIQGIGNYGGIKKMQFTIVNKKLIGSGK